MNEKDTLSNLQPIVFRQLQNSFEHGRLAHAYLFEGDSGTGKEMMALWFVKHLFCLDLKDNQPCEKCNNCLRISQKEHPDVIEVLPEGQLIKVDQIRELQKELAKSGFESNKKVVLIHQAEKMNVNSANSLLKFLEEPPKNFMIILMTSALGKILPTIQSRSQIIHFQGLAKNHLIQQLQTQENLSVESASLLADLTNSYQKAVELSNDEWFNEAKETVMQWFRYLEKDDPQGFVYVQKKLVKIFKEKNQQRLAFEMLGYFSKSKRNQVLKNDITMTEKYNRLLAESLKAIQKLEANVAFQSIAEQITLHVIFK